MVESTTVPPHVDHQQVALIQARHLSAAIIRRKTARRYANTYELEGLSRRQMRKLAKAYLRKSEDQSPRFKLQDSDRVEEEGKIDKIREGIIQKEENRLNAMEEKGVSKLKRGKILFIAKSKRLSGQTEEERVRMYKEAGHTDKDIEAITGEKLAKTSALTVGIFGFTWGARIGASVFDKIVPIGDVLPKNATGVAASIALYAVSYGAFARQNLRLTKDDEGTSTNLPVTLTFHGAKNLVSNNNRDRLAVGLPTAANTLLVGGFYTGIIEGTTGNSNKVIVANLINTGLNVLYAAGAEAWIRRRNKRGISYVSS